MTLLDRIASRLFDKQIKDQVRAQLSTLEDSFIVGSDRSVNARPHDRFKNDFDEILSQSLDAWRTNPLARRIVGLTTQYVVGAGVDFSCKHKYTGKFLKDFYNHPKNQLKLRVHEWCDELTRTGNLFLLMSTDAAGMSYFRAFPTDQVEKITSADNDIEQEQSIRLKATAERESKEYRVYDENNDSLDAGISLYSPVFFHFSINRAVGSQFGDSDLAPILKWLSRYSNWLEDRARLNRFRNAFLYVVKAKFTNNAERLTRQAQLNTNPPQPGSILVTDESEAWEILSPKLEASDAEKDGLALKKMIAAGVGIPLHFLAEPESSTRTTAEAAGGPTYRHFEERQEFFENLLLTLLRAVVERRAAFDKRIKKEAEITVQGADISSRDNVSLAMAATNMLNVLKDLRDRGLIDDAEFVARIYRAMGESIDVEKMLQRGKDAPAPVLKAQPPPQSPDKSPIIKQDVKIDPDTGEEIPK